MQPLIADKKPSPRPNDPAPSKAAYRLNRLWLTPSFRSMLRTGIPAFSVMALGVWYLADEARVEQLKLQVSELRDTVEQRPEFMVNLMRIDSVSAELAEDIREVTALDFPISSFDLDLTHMRARILELDAVKHAELVVRPGGVLEIQVVERLPAIVWRGRDALELLDDSGHRVGPLANRADRQDLPLIVGDGADEFVPQALAILQAAAPIRSSLRGLSRVGQRRWDLVLVNQRRILLPESKPIAALRRVIALNAINDLLARDFLLIDMRIQSRPTVKLSGNAVKLLREIKRTDPTNTDEDDV